MARGRPHRPHARQLIGECAMTFFDRFRTKPDWQQDDPNVRAAAVKRMQPEEQALLASIARNDSDAGVRKAAIRKLRDPRIIAEIAHADSHDSVRDAGTETLIAIATSDAAAAATAPVAAREAEAALLALTAQQDLASVARHARSESIATAALSRITDPRSLASVARNADHPAVRLKALLGIESPALLAEVASRSEHKDVSLAAVERIADRALLETVTTRARNKAASRKARATMTERDERAKTEEEAARLREIERRGSADERKREEMRAEPEPAPALESELASEIATREALCETVAALDGDHSLDGLEGARAAWDHLGPLPGSDALAERFARESAACRKRYDTWKAAQETLARFEALCAEAEGEAASSDLSGARRRMMNLHKSWVDAPGNAQVPNALRARFEKAGQRLAEREARSREEQALRERHNAARLQDICAKLESFAAAETFSLKEADQLLRDAKSSLQDPGPLPSKRERDELVARLDSARKALYPKLQALREDEEWKRWANQGVQEELIARTEALLQSDNHDAAARELREIENRWKEVSQVSKEKAEELWHRFVAARDEVRSRCNVFFAKRAEELAENKRRKEALCAQAESLADSTDWVRTADALQKLQEEWKTVGPVPRPESQAIWERFRGACDRFFTRRKEDRKQRAGLWAENLSKKIALCERAEALSGSSEWDKAADEIKKLQAEWKSVGPIRKNRSEEVWLRFRKACDAFFDRYNRRDQLEMAELVAARQRICARIEALLPAADSASGSGVPEGLLEMVREAQAAWRQGKPLPREEEAMIEARFVEARGRLVSAYRQAFEGTEFDPDATIRKMEKLCARIEQMVSELEPGGVPDGLEQDLAERLRQALAANALGVRSDTAEAKWKSVREEIDAAQAAWRRLASQPVEGTAPLAGRFERACQRFFDLRPAGHSRPQSHESVRR